MSYLKDYHINDIVNQYNLQEHFTELLYKDLKIDLDWSKVTYASYFIMYKGRKYVSKRILYEIFAAGNKTTTQKEYDIIIKDYFGYLPEAKNEKQKLYETVMQKRKNLLINFLEKDIWKLNLFKANVLLENTDNLFVIDNISDNGWVICENTLSNFIKIISNKIMMRKFYEDIQELYDYGKDKDFFISLESNIDNFAYKENELSFIDIDSFYTFKQFLIYLEFSLKEKDESWHATFKDYWHILDILDTYIELPYKKYKKILIKV
jgi:hypothetical protein